MRINGYHDLALETPGCHPGEPVYTAKFKFDVDLSDLFPFINAVGEESIYYKNPHTVQFTLEGVRCALYPDYTVAVPFGEREDAISFIARLIEFLNDLDNRKHTIEPDHKIFKPVPVIEIFKLLPRTNCKKCGYPTCMAFSAALSKREVNKNNCHALEHPEDDNAAKLNALLFPDE